MFQTLLSIHVVAAIMAFGPTFTFPILGMLANKHPAAEHVLITAIKKISQGMGVPIGLVQGLTGVLLIVNRNIDVSKNAWLGVSIILYVAAMAAAALHQLPGTRRVIDLTTPGSDIAANRAEITAISRRLRLVNVATLTAIVLIAVLMVWKPGLTTT
jgi:hypothetical protein